MVEEIDRLDFEDRELELLSDKVGEEKLDMKDYEGQVYIFNLKNQWYHHDEIDPSKEKYEFDGKEYNLKNHRAMIWGYRKPSRWWLLKQKVIVWIFDSEEEEALTPSMVQKKAKYTKLNPAAAKVVVDQQLESNFVAELIHQKAPLTKNQVILIIIFIAIAVVIYQFVYGGGF